MCIYKEYKAINILLWFIYIKCDKSLNLVELSCIIIPNIKQLTCKLNKLIKNFIRMHISMELNRVAKQFSWTRKEKLKFYTYNG